MDKHEVGGGSWCRMTMRRPPPRGEEIHKGHPIVQGFQCQAGTRVRSPQALGPGRSFWVGEGSGTWQSLADSSPLSGKQTTKVDPIGCWPARSLARATRAGRQGALTFLPHQALLDVADVSEEVAHCGDLGTEAGRL